MYIYCNLIGQMGSILLACALSTPPVLIFKLDSAVGLSLLNPSSEGRYIPFDVSFGAFYDNGYFDIVNSKVEIHHNGGHFLVIQRESIERQELEPRIKVIINWEQELEGN